MKFTPIYLNKEYNIRYVFPRLYTRDKEEAILVGKSVGGNETSEFTGKAIDLDTIIYDETKKRILAPFTYIDDGDTKATVILILDEED